MDTGLHVWAAVQDQPPLIANFGELMCFVFFQGVSPSTLNKHPNGLKNSLLSYKVEDT